LAKYRRAVTEIEEHANLLGQRLQCDTISDRFAHHRDENNARRSSSSVDFAREAEHRGYRSARRLRAEIVVHSRAMSYAKYYDRKNSDRESLTERDSTILSMSPALRPVKESA
jgi:TPP-dependent trihydroxycyclohexane-1,2-dione (THcHDO) dehydratase